MPWRLSRPVHFPVFAKPHEWSRRFCQVTVFGFDLFRLDADSTTPAASSAPTEFHVIRQRLSSQNLWHNLFD